MLVYSKNKNGELKYRGEFWVDRKLTHDTIHLSEQLKPNDHCIKKPSNYIINKTFQTKVFQTKVFHIDRIIVHGEMLNAIVTESELYFETFFEWRM